MNDVQISALLNRTGMPDAPAYACTSTVVLPRVLPIRRGWGSTGLKIPVVPLMSVLEWLLNNPSVVMTDGEREEYARDMRLAHEDAPEVDHLQSPEMLADVLRSRLLASEGEPIIFADDLTLHPGGKHPCLQRDAVELRVSFVHPTAPKCFADKAAYAEYDVVNKCLNVRLDAAAWNATESPDDTASIRLEFKFRACAPYTPERDAELHGFVNGFNAQLQSFRHAMRILNEARLNI